MDVKMHILIYMRECVLAWVHGCLCACKAMRVLKMNFEALCALQQKNSRITKHKNNVPALKPVAY